MTESTDIADYERACLCQYTPTGAQMWIYFSASHPSWCPMSRTSQEGHPQGRSATVDPPPLQYG